MARTLQQIQDSILSAKETQTELSGLTDSLTTNSKTSIWKLFIYVVAYAIWVLETLFDTHKAEVLDALTQLKPHTARWYRNKALAFQYGVGLDFKLIEDTDQFNNATYTAEQIAASKIIKYAAVTESSIESRLIVKIATEKNGLLEPIGEDEKFSFDAYINEIKDAGVKITVLNYVPDRLQLKLTIKIDPMVLNRNGMKILKSDGGEFPVVEAISAYMKELPFNGMLVLNHLVDKLQAVEGVLDPRLEYAKTSWIDTASNGYGSLKDIKGETLPVSGYFTWSLSNEEYKTIIEYVV
ncbi:nucleotidyltransferase [Epilithonimonas zeae]|uniref:Nucleotidyltransferase n=1 Tax=Epilithonimonas zeae TaxID=1416779 RepID=A0A1N6GVX8_9FLAO|nr:nucleotidyltransferase [Epilithonimonas zeae]SIO11710.1 hypothetical protein SAMN05444409_2089 [Epilithonimonas zeae]